MTVTNPNLITPAEVAQLFRVHVGTVKRWARKGSLDFITTPGGHRRFYRAQCEAIANRDNHR